MRMSTLSPSQPLHCENAKFGAVPIASSVHGDHSAMSAPWTNRPGTGSSRDEGRSCWHLGSLGDVSACPAKPLRRVRPNMNEEGPDRPARMRTAGPKGSSCHPRDSISLRKVSGMTPGIAFDAALDRNIHHGGEEQIAKLAAALGAMSLGQA